MSSRQKSCAPPEWCCAYCRLSNAYCSPRRPSTSSRRTAAGGGGGRGLRRRGAAAAGLQRRGAEPARLPKAAGTPLFVTRRHVLPGPALPREGAACTAHVQAMQAGRHGVQAHSRGGPHLCQAGTSCLNRWCCRRAAPQGAGSGSTKRGEEGSEGQEGWRGGDCRRTAWHAAPAVAPASQACCQTAHATWSLFSDIPCMRSKAAVHARHQELLRRHAAPRCACAVLTW